LAKLDAFGRSLVRGPDQRLVTVTKITKDVGERLTGKASDGESPRYAVERGKFDTLDEAAIDFAEFTADNTFKRFGDGSSSEIGEWGTIFKVDSSGKFYYDQVFKGGVRSATFGASRFNNAEVVAFGHSHGRGGNPRNVFFSPGDVKNQFLLNEQRTLWGLEPVSSYLVNSSGGLIGAIASPSYSGANIHTISPDGTYFPVPRY